MSKKKKTGDIPKLGELLECGFSDYREQDHMLTIGECIDNSRGNFVKVQNSTDDGGKRVNIRVVRQENKNENSFLPQEIKDISNKKSLLRKNAGREAQENKNVISDYELACQLAEENNFILLEENLYYGDKKLGYFQGVTPELGEKIIRKITQQKYKPLITSRRVREIINWFNSFEHLKVDEEIIKSKKTFINFSNCVVNAANGEIYDQSLDFYFTNYVNADYPINYEPRGFTFEHFMEQVTGGNKYLYKRLQEIFGYVLSDIRDLKIILYFVGPKDSGKSVAINLLQEMVGKTFSTNLSLHDLNEKFRLGKLYRKKLNCCGETSEINLNRTDIIKAVSGNDTILAEDKNISPFSFTNKAALLFAGNDLPKIVNLGKTRAFSDRLIIVPFNYPTEKSKQDINLIEKLIEEKSYIAQWAMKGLKRLIKNNYVFTSCNEVQEMYDAYLRENNSVQTFIEEQCTKDPRYRIHTFDLVESYNEYCYKEGIIPVEDKAFHKTLKNIRGINPGRFRLDGLNLNGYIGITLNKYLA